MLVNQKKIITAIFIIAVIATNTYLTGCVTRRDIDEIKGELKEVKAQNNDTQKKVASIDSLITNDTEANKKLRVDISTSINELQQRIDNLLENYNELLAMVQKLNQEQNVTHIIKSSPGSQPESSQPPVSSDSTITEPQQPAIDCGNTYDESFVLARREQYEKAIEGFHKFLKYCPKDQLAENAHYWISECYYSLDKFKEAIDETKYLIENYKNSIYISRALYLQARSEQELGNNKKAKQIYKKLIDEYPETHDANQAKERLKDLK